MPDKNHDSVPVGDARNRKVHERVELVNPYGHRTIISIVGSPKEPAFLMIDSGGLSVTFHVEDLRRLAAAFARAADLQAGESL